MNHVELHNKMSDVLDRLYKGQMKKEFAKEFFNGAGKLISNCKNELDGIQKGYQLDVPLLGIKAIDSQPHKQLVQEKEIKKISNK